MIIHVNFFIEYLGSYFRDNRTTVGTLGSRIPAVL